MIFWIDLLNFAQSDEKWSYQEISLTNSRNSSFACLGLVLLMILNIFAAHGCNSSIEILKKKFRISPENVKIMVPACDFHCPFMSVGKK